MAYAKLPKLIRDSGIGIETINQAVDNEEQIAADYAVEHFIGGNGGSGVYTPMTIGASDVGRHDHVTIPRAVAKVTVQTYAGPSGTTQYLPAFAKKSDRHFINVQRVAAGVYFLPLKKVDASRIWIEVLPVVTASTQVRFCNTRFTTAFPSTGTPGALAGVIVHLFERGASAFAPADYDFTVAVFSR